MEQVPHVTCNISLITSNFEPRYYMGTYSAQGVIAKVPIVTRVTLRYIFASVYGDYGRPLRSLFQPPMVVINFNFFLSSPLEHISAPNLFPSLINPLLTCRLDSQTAAPWATSPWQWADRTGRNPSGPDRGIDPGGSLRRRQCLAWPGSCIRNRWGSRQKIFALFGEADRS